MENRDLDIDDRNSTNFFSLNNKLRVRFRVMVRFRDRIRVRLVVRVWVRGSTGGGAPTPRAQSRSVRSSCLVKFGTVTYT